MIENVIIMGLDLREQHWRELESQCLAKGWKTKVFISGSENYPHLNYDFIDPDSNNIPSSWRWGDREKAAHHWKAFCTHQQIIKYAVKKNFEHILLLEDDSAILETRFDIVWNRLLPEIEEKCGNWDFIFLGGHYFAGDYVGDMYGPLNLEIERKYKENNENCYLMYIQNFGGFFGVLIHERMYLKILNMPAVEPIDCQLNRLRTLREINSFNILPSIVYPKNGLFSLCEQKYVSRNILE